MAELTKPQYSNPKSYPSDRKIYQVQPARTDFTRPSEVPDQMFGVANIMKALGEGLENYQEAYAQSEKTANVLQAKGLLIDKMKDTQRIKELIATQLPLTGYEHLNLKKVLDKYRTTDLEGRTDLNIGKDLEHNVSPMLLPDDIPDHVREMIEDQWVGMDVDIISGLMGEIETVQSKQTLAVMNRYENEYKKNLLKAYQTTDNRYAGQVEANKLRLKHFQNIEELGNVGTWGEQEVIDKKLHAGQLMLNAEFLSQYHNVKEGTDPKINREKALSEAVKGRYKYKDENGDTFTLDSIYYDKFFFTEQERLRVETIKKRNTIELNEQNFNLQQFIRKTYKAKTFDFNELWERISDDKQWDKIPSAQRYQILFSEEVRRLKEAESEKKTQDAEDKTARLNDLGNKLSEIAIELAEDFDGNIGTYAKKNEKGNWRAKSGTELQRITKNKEFREEYINNIILAKTRAKINVEKKYEAEIKKAKASDFQQKMIALADSGIGGPSDILLNFGKLAKNSQGQDVWIADPAKLEDDKAGGKYLLNAGIGRDNNDPNRSNDDVIAIRLAVMQDLINYARTKHTKFKRDIIGQDIGKNEEIQRMNTIASTYINNLESVLAKGPDAFQDSFPTWEGKNPTEEQRVMFNAFTRHMDGLTYLAMSKDEYTLEELITHQKNLLAGNVNGNPVNDKFMNQHLAFSKTINNHFEARARQLREEPQKTGFLESGQDSYLARHGTYDLSAYATWLQERGIFNRNDQNVVSKAILKQNKEIENFDTFQKSGEYINSLIGELNKYGPIGSTARQLAFEQIRNSFPFNWRRMLESIYKGELVNNGKVEIKWLKANKK